LDDDDDVYILGLSVVVNSKTENKEAEKEEKKDERTNRKNIKLLCIVTAAIFCWQEAL
jgi:hypothetical protein